MKIKLISLITALLCLAVLLVSCSDPCTSHLDADYDGKCDTCGDEIQTPSVNCTEHVDADNDGICDTPHCGTVIVTKIEEVEVPVEVEIEVPVPNEKETGVAMVVKPIPSDANVADYFSFDYESGTIIYNTAKLDSVKWDSADSELNDRFIVFSAIEADRESKRDEGIEIYWRVYTIYDLKNDEIIITYTTEKYEFVIDTALEENDLEEQRLQAIDQIYATFSACRGCVIEAEEFIGSSYSYYTYTGTLLVEDSSERLYAGLEETYNYLNDGKTTVAFDSETGKVLNKADNAFFVHRPDFDFCTADEKFGVLVENNTFSFYDLESWIDLTFEYTVPSYCEWDIDQSVFFLANGTILIEGSIELPYNAVSYDVYQNGEKYDIVYKILNPAKKTVTDADFGYVIFYDATDVYELTDKVSNVFYVAPIENQMSDYYSYKTLAVDAELNILCELEPLVKGAYGWYNVVADDRMLVGVDVGNNNTVRYIVNSKGEIINTLPIGASISYGAIWVGNKAYAIDDKTYETPLVDLDEYDSSNTYSNSFIWMTKTVTTEPDPDVAGSVSVTTKYIYVWNSSLSAPKLVDSQVIDYNGSSIRVYDSFENLFVVKKDVASYNESESSYDVDSTYIVYNVNGEEVAKYENVSSLSIEYRSLDDDDGFYLVKVGNKFYRLTYEAPAATPVA